MLNQVKLSAHGLRSDRKCPCSVLRWHLYLPQVRVLPGTIRVRVLVRVWRKCELGIIISSTVLNMCSQTYFDGNNDCAHTPHSGLIEQPCGAGWKRYRPGVAPDPAPEGSAPGVAPDPAPEGSAPGSTGHVYATSTDNGRSNGAMTSDVQRGKSNFDG